MVETGVFGDEDGRRLVRHLSEVGVGALRAMWLERAKPSREAMERCLKHTRSWDDALLRHELQRVVQQKNHHASTLERLLASKFAKYYASTRPTRAQPVRVTPPPMLAVCRALFAALRAHPHTLNVVVPEQPLLANWRLVTADCLADAFESLLAGDGYVHTLPPPPPPRETAAAGSGGGSVIVGETTEEEEKEAADAAPKEDVLASPPRSPTSTHREDDDDDIDPSDSVSNIGAPPAAAADDDAVSVVLVG